MLYSLFIVFFLRKKRLYIYIHIKEENANYNIMNRISISNLLVPTYEAELPVDLRYEFYLKISVNTNLSKTKEWRLTNTESKMLQKR